MASPTDMADRHGAILTRLAELGMTLAEDLHARALAAKDDRSANDLALAFHRVSRSLRQTLTLEARLGRERKLALREAAQREASETLDRIQKKRAQVLRAVAPLVWTEYEGDDAEALVEDLDSWVYQASQDDGFLDEPIETIIGRVREAFGVPADEDATNAAPSETVGRSSA